MCFGRIILPIKTNESTIWNTQLHTNEKLSDLYKDISIATQCGLLSAHINLPAVTSYYMSAVNGLL
jgi:hypothetical protein